MTVFTRRSPSHLEGLRGDRHSQPGAKAGAQSGEGHGCSELRGEEGCGPTSRDRRYALWSPLPPDGAGHAGRQRGFLPEVCVGHILER